MVLIAAAGAALGGSALPALSSAQEPRQTYMVSACSVGDDPAPLDGWTATSAPSSALVPVDACATKREFGFSAGAGSMAVGRWSFVSPRGTKIVSMRAYDLAGTGDPGRSLMLFQEGTALPQNPRTIPWFTGGMPIPGGPLPVSSTTASEYQLEFRCPNECPEASTLRVSRMDTLLWDASAPSVGFDAVKRSFSFTDEGGGVETVDLAVDGTELQLKLGGERCRRPFVYVVPCATSGEISMERELGMDLSGRSVFATLTDLAGNRTYAGPFVLPARELLAAPTPAQIQGPTSVLTVDGPSRVRVPYGPTKITGVVRDGEGFPIATGHVDVASRVKGQPWQAVAAPVSDERGRFTATIPKGPSRELRLSYEGSTQTVNLLVAAPVRLSASRKRLRNGQTVTFVGRIPEAGTTRTRVALQAWARDKWMPFRTVELRGGRFRARYRFTGTFSTQRYRFRAVVGDDPGFVFAAASSRSVTILVRPKKRS
jgi:hypothetical protein